MAGKKPRDLTPHELFRRVDAAIPRDYRHRQGVFAQGDKADAIFHVQNGNVESDSRLQGWKEGCDRYLETLRLLWRRLLGQTIPANVECDGDSALSDRASEEGHHRS